MDDVYIVIREYNETLAKRQPWYAIKKIIIDLEMRGQSVTVVSDINQLPQGYKGVVLKIFSLSDIWRNNVGSFQLVYLMTFPVYRFGKFIKLPLRVLVANWVDLKRIFFASLVPTFFFSKAFARAKCLVTISDRSDEYLASLSTAVKYYPFISGNWGGQRAKKKGDGVKVVGYFGPPFTTRCFDQVTDFFSWLDTSGHRYNKKIITRIERDELKAMEAKYLSRFYGNPTYKVVSGFLSREELGVHLCDIDVLVLPFRIVMSELPVVVLEALELGISIVTTSDSGIQLLTEKLDTVLIVDDFTSCSYDMVLDFIEKEKTSSFDVIQKQIDAQNKKALEFVCLK